jgi:predicted anti-sigma-YlaC factor YlaD
MTVFTRHVFERLAPYLDGELSSLDVEAMERHVRGCARCRAEYERVRFGAALLEHLPLLQAPEAIWQSIEAGSRQSARSRLPRPAWRRPAVAAAVVALLSVGLLLVVGRPAPRWDVARLDGAPAVAARHISGVGKVGVGEWIETDSGSRASVKIGAIGDVEVQPNTRIRVVAARRDEHRLALARGEIRARITAPPRLFFVDTASGTAVDLGCEYVLDTDEDGFGLLRVTKGWVAFQWNGLESLVPAGARCETRPHAGPGVPYFDDAPEALKQAVASFAFEKAGSDVLGVILAESHVRDTLTLWHLVSRVDMADRGRLYDRISALTPVPGVTREQVLKLDPDTLRHWKNELAWTW